MKRRGLIITGLLLATACREQQPAARQGAVQAADSVLTCDADVRRVVEGLGARLKLVSLLAPDSIVQRSLRMAYAPFVTPELLAEWQAQPRLAPGREVSNPWPVRIAIRTMSAEGDRCRVEGDVIYVETGDTSSIIEIRPVTLHVRKAADWRISAYESAGQQPTHGAAQVVERYYAAIQRADFQAAYQMWADSGRASGQTPAEFANGFAETERVQVTVDDDVRLEGAAGSQYATVPVEIEAVLRNGERQIFAGTYTLRRSLVDGATREQRTWHIHSAEITAR